MTILWRVKVNIYFEIEIIEYQPLVEHHEQHRLRKLFSTP